MAHRRIDVHHHCIPPAQAEAFSYHRTSSGTKWSIAASLEDMDKAGIDTAITSILNPGVWFGEVNEESRKLARDCNEWQAKLEQDHPGRFRSFAVIPLAPGFVIADLNIGQQVQPTDDLFLWLILQLDHLL